MKSFYQKLIDHNKRFNLVQNFLLLKADHIRFGLEVLAWSKTICLGSETVPGKAKRFYSVQKLTDWSKIFDLVNKIFFFQKLIFSVFASYLDEANNLIWSGNYLSFMYQTISIWSKNLKIVAKTILCKKDYGETWPRSSPGLACRPGFQPEPPQGKLTLLKRAIRTVC